MFSPILAILLSLLQVEAETMYLCPGACSWAETSGMELDST